MEHYVIPCHVMVKGKGMENTFLLKIELNLYFMILNNCKVSKKINLVRSQLSSRLETVRGTDRWMGEHANFRSVSHNTSPFHVVRFKNKLKFVTINHFCSEKKKQ